MLKLRDGLQISKLNISYFTLNSSDGVIPYLKLFFNKNKHLLEDIHTLKHLLVNKNSNIVLSLMDMKTIENNLLNYDVKHINEYNKELKKSVDKTRGFNVIIIDNNGETYKQHKKIVEKLYYNCNSVCSKILDKYVDTNKINVDSTKKISTYNNKYILKDDCFIQCNFQKISYDNFIYLVLKICNEYNLTKHEIIKMIKNNNNNEPYFWDELCNNRDSKILKLFELKNNLNRLRESSWICLSNNCCDEAVEILLNNKNRINWDSFSINSHPLAIELLKNNRDKINWIKLSTNKSSHAVDMVIKYLKDDSILHTYNNHEVIKWLSTNPLIFEYDYKKMYNTRWNEINKELVEYFNHPIRVKMNF